jgi:hypothetical protein
MMRRCCRRALWTTLALLLMLAHAARAGEGFRVEQVETRRSEGAYLLDARIDYGFSERALEALQNGVPLTLVLQVQVRAANDWLWNQSLVDQQLRYRIRYKPLSGRYLVAQLPDDKGRTYVTREAAIAALGEINGLYLVSTDRLDPEQDYELHLRASLDIEELPLPLRPMAYLSSDWKQKTGWTSWPLTP